MEYKVCVDLHIHSTASDGSLEPAEIIAEARELKLKAIAITDHDTVEGSKAAIQSGIPSGLHFFTGVEISSTAPEPFVCSGNFHILGYGFALDNPALNQALSLCRKAREERNPKILAILNQNGMDLTMEEVVEEAGGGLIGRPHMASLMMKKGYVGSIHQAFGDYLAKGRPAYVEKYRICCEDAVSLIRNAGGIAVLAHPVSLEMDDNDLELLIEALKGIGLGGIEAFYSTHSPDFTATLCRIAEKNGLIITGGSDYHGSLKTNIKMGTGKGNLSIPSIIYETLSETLLESARDCKH